MANFAMRVVHGPGWDSSRRIRDQQGWAGVRPLWTGSSVRALSSSAAQWVTAIRPCTPSRPRIRARYGKSCSRSLGGGRTAQYRHDRALGAPARQPAGESGAPASIMRLMNPADAAMLARYRHTNELTLFKGATSRHRLRWGA